MLIDEIYTSAGQFIDGNVFQQQSYTIYKYNPICQENGALKGSCQDFDTRKQVEWEKVTNLTYDEVLER